MWGCGQPETAHHALFSCSRLEDLWKESGCEPLKAVDEILSMCEIIASWNQVDV